MTDRVLDAFLSAASFWPVKEISVSAWVEHAPFAFWLVGATEPATVVELGSHTGFSYFAFCQAAEALALPTQVYAIDTWVGDEHAGLYGEDVYQSVRTIAERDYPDRSHLIRATFDEAREQFADGSIDILHVDGRHFYDDARHDVDTYLSALSPRGVMVLHDIAVHDNGFGVYRVWDELQATYDTFAFPHCNGLGVVAVGPDAPELVRALTRLPVEEADLVRAAYARLGAAVPTPWIVEDPQIDAALRRLPEAENELGQARRTAEQSLVRLEDLTEHLQEATDRAKSLDARVRITSQRLADAEAELARHRASRARVMDSVSPGMLRMVRALSHPRSTAARALGGGARTTPAASHARELFDAEWYAATYGASSQSPEHLFADYVAHGAAAGRQPNPLFDADWYAENNPDLAGLDGLGLVEHYVQHGGTEGRSPHPFFDGAFYLDDNPDIAAVGVNPLVHYLRHGDLEGRQPNPFFSPDRYRELTDSEGFAAGKYLDSPLPRPATTAEFDPVWYLATYADAARSGTDPLLFHLRYGGDRPTTPDDMNEDSARVIISHRWNSTESLRSVKIADAHPLTMVTDSVGPDSLFGGVATALIVSAEWAKASGRSLRILTRHGRPSAEGCYDVWKLAGVTPPDSVEFVFNHPGGTGVVDVADDDLWLTTSWWTTAAVRATVDPAKVVYLLQEDERAFYPSGDDSLRAWQQMTDASSLTLVNSGRLLDALVADGATNLSERGIWFDGSFATFAQTWAPRAFSPRRGLFFYSRPNNTRNLFGLGLQTLTRAFERGALQSDEWTLYCVGPGTPKGLNIAGTRTVVKQALSWPAYRALLPDIHLGLCLMATPHTSYPPLDLVAAGAQVVTNDWPGKTGLDVYGPRLLVAPPAVDALVEALAEADARSRAGTVDQSIPPVLSRTWADQLDATVGRLLTEFGRV